MDFICFWFEFFGGKVLLLVEVKKYIHRSNGEHILGLDTVFLVFHENINFNILLYQINIEICFIKSTKSR